jgi:PAS domain S-box-containing protein
MIAPLRTIRGRLLVAALCVEAAMLTLMVGNTMRVLSSNLTAQAQSYAEQLSPVLDAALVTPLARQDYATVQAILADCRAVQALRYLAVADSRGKVVAANGWPRDTELPPPDAALSLALKAGGYRYDVRSPIKLGGQVLGILQFGLDLGQVVAARRQQLAQSLIIAVAEIVLSAALLTVIALWLTRRLDKLARLSEEVARGNYTPAAADEGTDDIGRLGAAFNAMSHAVHTHVARLTDAVDRRVSAEQQAVRAQQQLVDAIESVADAMAVYDSDDRLVICNAAFRNLVGFPVGGRSDHAHFATILREAFMRGKYSVAGDFETWFAARLERHRRADGQALVARAADGRWFQGREFQTHDGGVVTVRTDITALKQREQELEALRRRYELILGSAGEGIVGLDSVGRITFANPAACRMLGDAAEQLVGRGLADFTGSDGQSAGEAWGSPLLAACRDGQARQGQARMFPMVDASFPVDYFIGPIIEAGQVTGAVLMFRDATLRLQYEWTVANQKRELARQVSDRTAELRREVEIRAKTEEALRASRKRLKRITDSLVEGVVVIDGQNQLSFANPSAMRILAPGDTNEIEGQRLDDFLRVRTADGETTFSAVLARTPPAPMAAMHDDDAVFELTDGRTMSVAYSCSPLAEGNSWPGTIISFRDIGALKQAQHEAMQSARLAGLGQLAAGIAHEINTPIQYIGDNLAYIGEAIEKLGRAITVARTLAESVSDVPAAAQALAQFHAAAPADELLFLLDDVPAAVRESLEGVGQIGRIVLSMKEFSHPGSADKTCSDINHALANTLTVTRNAWKNAAEVECDFDPTLPPVLCHGGELSQVFLNLITNAADAIESSGKSLPGRIEVVTSHRDGWAEVRISDTGTGIPDAIRDRIFDPFFTTKPVGKGTGQGLAICHDVVVVKHGGVIEVGGKEGEGAVFTIRLPINNGGTALSDNGRTALSDLEPR